MIATPAMANNGKGNNKSSQSTSTQVTTQTTTTQTTTTQTTTPTAPITQSGTIATPSLTSPALSLGLSDLNKSFLINFGGNVNTQDVAGLSSEALFTFTSFKTIGSQTIATFDVKLTNTSSGGIESRVSGLGFNTSGTLVSSSVSGLFSKSHMNGSFPNQFGNVDVCFNSGNTCQGGSSGGVSSDPSLPGTFDSGSFSFALTLDGALSSLTLDNFGVRYQSINGNGFNGDSGTGGAISVTPVFEKPIDGTKPPDSTNPTPPTTPEQPKPPTPQPPKPRTVPEPSAVGAMLLVSAIALRFGKKREAAEVEQS